MDPVLKPVVESFIDREQLPADYFDTVERWFLPMVKEILQKIAAHGGTFVIGVSGSQGSGKSTLAALLVLLLNRMLGLRCVDLSIDDFYLTHGERQSLGEHMHPLLATRGVPGTHDVALAVDTINALMSVGQVSIPRFDKAVDDRLPMAQWPIVQAPVDVIVLEGWCLSIGPQGDEDLAAPVNDLEREEDPQGIWRRYVNDAIRDDYMTLYAMVDYLIMLKTPSFDKVYEWRQNQEDKLAQKYKPDNSSAAGRKNNKIMTPARLKRFIQHYERVTRHGLNTLPAQADTVFQLTDRQTIDGRVSLK